MSWIQRFIKKWLSPELAAAMEADSRAWKFRCSRCGREVSIWDLGGIRYKAYGNSVAPRRCPTCGITLHRLVKYPTELRDGGPPPDR